MKKLFTVKLDDNHTAKKEDVVDGYLGNVFGNGRIAKYTRGEAIKKARVFGGKIEPADIKVCQIDRNQLIHGVEVLLDKFGAAYIQADKGDQCFFYANVIDDILEQQPNMDKKTKDQMFELSDMLLSYDYLMLIS